MRETGSCCAVVQGEWWLYKAAYATFPAQNLPRQDKSCSLQKFHQQAATFQSVAPCHNIHNPVAYSTVLVLVHLSSNGGRNGREVSSDISTVFFHIRLFQTVAPAFGAGGHHPEGLVFAGSDSAIQISTAAFEQRSRHAACCGDPASRTTVAEEFTFCITTTKLQVIIGAGVQPFCCLRSDLQQKTTQN